MNRKFNVWLDSGANHSSCYRSETSLDELGITCEDWEKMTEEEKDLEMREVAFERSEWGWSDEGEDE